MPTASAHSPASRTADRATRSSGGAGRRVADGILPVTLFEDAAGRLVLVAEGDAPPITGESLLRIGRARIPARHLAATVVQRLRASGHASVDGPDALNVLLAFADSVAARAVDPGTTAAAATTTDPGVA